MSKQHLTKESWSSNRLHYPCWILCFRSNEAKPSLYNFKHHHAVCLRICNLHLWVNTSLKTISLFFKCIQEDLLSIMARFCLLMKAKSCILFDEIWWIRINFALKRKAFLSCMTEYKAKRYSCLYHCWNKLRTFSEN